MKVPDDKLRRQQGHPIPRAESSRNGGRLLPESAHVMDEALFINDLGADWLDSLEMDNRDRKMNLAAWRLRITTSIRSKW